MMQMDVRPPHGAEFNRPAEDGVYSRHLQSAYWLTLAIGFASLLLWTYRPVSVSSNRAVEACRGINPNSAARFELAQLPAVGEGLAKRIVDYREFATRRNPRKRCFEKPADLLKVKGIGSKTLHKITPFLILDEPKGPMLTSP